MWRICHAYCNSLGSVLTLLVRCSHVSFLCSRFYILLTDLFRICRNRNVQYIPRKFMAWMEVGIQPYDMTLIFFRDCSGNDICPFV